VRRHGRHSARLVGEIHYRMLRVPLPLMHVGLVVHLWALEPAAGVCRNCDECRDPDTRVHRMQKVRAIAIEAIRYDVREWQETLLPQRVEHRRRQLRFTLKGQFPRDIACGTAGGIYLGKPHFRQEQPLIHQGIPMP
jgi:hypothetical protein